jgi:hypothetical protein
MRARTYRPKVQNGTVTKRNRSTGSAKASRSSADRGRRQKNRREVREEGPNLFLTLVMVGALVAMGFVFALRSQINTRQLGQAEERLKGELDDIADQQRYDVLEQQRTMSLQESDRAAQEAGLIQPRFNQPEPKAKARTSQNEIPRNATSRASRAKKENNNPRQSDRLAQRR